MSVIWVHWSVWSFATVIKYTSILCVFVEKKKQEMLSWVIHAEIKFASLVETIHKPAWFLVLL